MNDVAAKTPAVMDDLRKVRQDVGNDKENGWCCKAGSVILVPTDKPINEWNEIAIRHMPLIEWYWKLD